MLGVKRKQPGDTLDYDIDFGDWLVEGDSLVAATATASPDGLVIGDVERLPPLVKVWLSGGVDGESYTVTVTVTTADGRVKTVNFNLRVSEC